MSSFKKLVGKKVKVDVEDERGGFNTKGILVSIDEAGWLTIQKKDGKLILVHLSRVESIVEQ